MNATAFPITHQPARHGWATAVLVLLSLAMFLPGFASLPPMDRDEPRFAQASKQMLESGDFVSIRFQGEARNKKPVGIYWLQAASVALGDVLGVADAQRQIWLYRLPSLVGAVITVLGTYWAGLALTSQRGAFFGAILMASTVLLSVEAHLAKTDAMLAATVVLAMGALARIYLASRPLSAHLAFTSTNEAVAQRATLALFWTAIAVGILIKGPITPMVPACAIVVLCIKDRSASWLRELKPLPGLLWTLLLVMPWFALILSRTNGAFLSDSLGHDMLGKVAGAQEAHGAPPGSYIAAFWATGWPMAPFAALAAPLAWRLRRDPKITFLLAWIVPTWLLFEALPTKLPHYVLPVYPALAILAGLGLLHRAQKREAAGFTPVIMVFLLLCIVPLAIALVLWQGQGLLWNQLSLRTVVLGAGTIAILIAAAAWAARSLRRQDAPPAVLATTAAALVAYLFILGNLLTPQTADRLDLSAKLAQAGRDVLAGECSDVGLATAGNHEPSFVFLAGTDLLLTDAVGAAQFLEAGSCRVAFVERRAEPVFLEALGETADVRQAERVAGTAINGGKSLDIGVYVRQRQHP